MHKRIVPVAIALLSVPLVGGMAYAATQSVSTRPSPQVVIPSVAGFNTVQEHPDDRTTATTVDDHGVDRTVAGSPTTTVAGHDAGDDRRPATATTGVTVTTVAGVDDRGRGGSGTDDRVNHDVNDDHGGRTVTSTVTPTTAPRVTVPVTTVDDHGRQAEPGDDRGGSSGATSSSGTSGSGGGGSGSSGSGKSGR